MSSPKLWEAGSCFIPLGLPAEYLGDVRDEARATALRALPSAPLSPGAPETLQLLKKQQKN